MTFDAFIILGLGYILGALTGFLLGFIVGKGW